VTKIGDRITDERGFWVVVGVAFEDGDLKVSRVRAGSPAHQVFVSRMPEEEVSLTVYPTNVTLDEIAKAEKVIASLVARGHNEADARRAIVSLFLNPRRFTDRTDNFHKEGGLDN
jgi:hypothetical protein